MFQVPIKTGCFELHWPLLRQIQEMRFVRNILKKVAGAAAGILVAAIPFCSAAKETLFTYDARPLNKLDARVAANANQIWDTVHLLAALQGLANREKSQFYLFYCSEFGRDTDQFWFDWLRGEDGWLKDREVVALDSVEAALKQLRSCYQGIVVYDPNVPATANLASTIAGCDSLLPVRFDSDAGSIYSLATKKLGLPIKRWLLNQDGTSLFTGKGLVPDTKIESSGSAKVDAYRWAIHHYLAAGKCGAGIAAYYIDSAWLKHPERASADMHTLSDHDYFIARKAFFFDLSPWADELPNDDPQQKLGLDRQAFLEVMRSLYDQAHGNMIKVGGFPPWPYKLHFRFGSGQ